MFVNAVAAVAVVVGVLFVVAVAAVVVIDVGGGVWPMWHCSFDFFFFRQDQQRACYRTRRFFLLAVVDALFRSESHALFWKLFYSSHFFTRVFRDCVVWRRKQGLLDDGTESEVDDALIELFCSCCCCWQWNMTLTQINLYVFVCLIRSRIRISAIFFKYGFLIFFVLDWRLCYITFVLEI